MINLLFGVSFTWFDCFAGLLVACSDVCCFLLGLFVDGNCVVCIDSI